ncbi:MAG: sodium:proton antiporter [Elusimicrobia bacterium]|nr:sodium:proton antiporter [Elusimicrobiota bacterium]
MIDYFLCIVLFCVGLYAILIKRNLIKIIIGLTIMEYAVNLFLVLIGYKYNATFPIFSRQNVATQQPLNMVDPLPQAMVLTAIIIGLAVTVILVGIAIRLYEKYKTFDIAEIRKLKG